MMFRRLFSLLAFLSLLGTANAQKVLGYFPDYGTTGNEPIQYQHMTDLAYAFIAPNSDGTLNTQFFTPATFAIVRDKAHAAGVKMHISVGGAGSPTVQLANATANATSRAKMIEELMKFISGNHQYNDTPIAGIDIDWEFPTNQTSRNNHETLLKELRQAMDAQEAKDGRTYELSCVLGGDVISNVSHADYINPNAFQYADYWHIMSYDMAYVTKYNPHHSPLQAAMDAVDEYNRMGCPKSKMLIGVPFYGRSGGGTIEYSQINSSGTQALYEGDQSGSYYYNGKTLITQKADFIMNEGGVGILIWEITQDRMGNDPYSLLKACGEAMSPYQCPLPAPNLGADVSICGSSSVTLNSGLTTGGGKTFTWKKGTQTLVSNTTATTYNATSAGTYTVEVSDGSCSRSDQIEVLGTLPTVDLGADVELCNPATATLDAGVSGNGLTYTWKKDNVTISGATAQTLTVDQAGVYSVTVSASGCSSSSDQVTVTSLLLDIPAVTACKNDPTTVTVNNPTSGATYSWFTTQTGGTASYTGSSVDVTLASTTTFYVEEEVTIGVNCQGLDSWDPSSSYSQYSEVIHNGKKYSAAWWANAGDEPGVANMWTYVDECGGGNGCERTPVTVTVDPNCSGCTAPEAKITSSDFDYCSDESGVSLVAKAVSGATYEWFKGTTSVGSNRTLNNATAGKYTVVVTKDACSATSDEVTVVENAVPSATITTTALEYCEGINGISLVAKAVTGATYEWFKGSTSVGTNRTLNNATAGIYTVTVSNNGCSETSSSVTVVENASPEATITTTDLSYCSGDNGLTLSAKAVSGATYEWFKGTQSVGTGQNLSNAEAGDYTVEVSKNGCTATSSSVTVVENGSLSISLSADQTNLCSPATATLDAGVSGAGYSFVWKKDATVIAGETSSTLSVSEAGVYEVTVTTSGTCSSSASDQVTITSSLVEIDDATACENDQVTLAVNNPETGVTYKWYDVATGGTELHTGATYDVTYTTDVTFYVEKEYPMGADCAGLETWASDKDYGGGAQVVHQGKKYNAKWYANAGDEPGTATGGSTAWEYVEDCGTGGQVCDRSAVSITKSTGCATCTTPDAQITSTDLEYCEGDNGVTLIAKQVSGATYEWYKGTSKVGTGVSLANATAGSYTVKVIDGTCEATSSAVTVVENALPSVTANASATTLCEGESLTLTGSGATSYAWDNGVSNGTSFVPALGTTTYTVTGVDAKGCENTDQVSVTVNALPTAKITSTDLEYCEGESGVSLTAQQVSGATYTWFKGSSQVGTGMNLNNATAGSYTVEVAVGSCMTTSSAVTVSENSAPAVVANASATSVCEGETVTLTGSGASSYTWDKGVQDGKAFAITSGGNYTVLGTDANGCTATDQVNITVNEAPTAKITSSGLEYCESTNGVTLSAEVVTGATYTWSNGKTGSSISNVTEGDYSVTVSKNGCTATSGTVTVTKVSSPTAEITSTNLDYCEGDNGVTLTAKNVSGATYTWSNGQTGRTISNVTSGTYTVTVALGTCQGTSSSVTVNENQAPTASITSSDLDYCEGDNGVTLTAQQVTGATYEWMKGGSTTVGTGQSLNNAQAGSYAVKVSANGCSTTSSTVSVQELGAPTAQIVSTNVEYCEGGSGVTLVAKNVSGASYQWSNGQTGLSISNATAGTYSVMVTDANGCSASSVDKTVIENALPTAVILTSGNELEYVKGTAGVTLNAQQVSGASYQWKKASVNAGQGQTLNNALEGEYTVTVTSDAGCEATSPSVTVVELEAKADIVINLPSGKVVAGDDVTLDVDVNDPSNVVTEVEYTITNNNDGSKEVLTATAPDFSVVWTADNTGDYTITAVAKDNSGNELGSAQENLKVDVIDSVFDGEVHALDVYPNPANDLVNLDGVEAYEQVEVLDMTGNILLQDKLDFGNQLNVTDLPDGVYMLHFIDGAGNEANRRLVVKH